MQKMKYETSSCWKQLLVKKAQTSNHHFLQRKLAWLNYAAAPEKQ